MRRSEAWVWTKPTPIASRTLRAPGRSAGSHRNAGTEKTPKSAAAERKAPA